MRARFVLATLSFVAAPLAAQAQLAKTPQLPSPNVLNDTIIVSSFDLANGAVFANPGTPMTMDHKVLGKQPTHFRASKFADFHDVTWISYPAKVPVYNGTSTGSCTTNNTIKMLVHFQVRAVKVFSPETGKTTFVLSNVARDTTCMHISG